MVLDPWQLPNETEARLAMVPGCFVGSGMFRPTGGAPFPSVAYHSIMGSDLTGVLALPLSRPCGNRCNQFRSWENTVRRQILDVLARVLKLCIGPLTTESHALGSTTYLTITHHRRLLQTTWMVWVSVTNLSAPLKNA